MKAYGVEQVKAIIQKQYHDFKIHQIIKVGEGKDCTAFEINNDYIFKFPKHTRASDSLINEISVLRYLKGKLPIPIPQVVLTGCACDDFAMSFVGYSKIFGTPLRPDLLRNLSHESQEQVAIDLARFLKALHSIEVKDLNKNLIIDYRKKIEDDHKKIKSIITGQIIKEQHEKVDGFYRELLDKDQYFCYKPCLIHNDFSSDHILYDVSKDRICGIIDFGDAAISDPDNDFMNLIEEDEEYGLEFGLKVLNNYDHPDIPLVLEKYKMKEKYWSFEKILYGKEYGYIDWYKEGMNEIKNI